MATVHVILGIDAAWTATEPSGVALVAGTPKSWRCLCVAPSYESFISRAEINWELPRFAGTPPDIGQLLSAARIIAGVEPTLVAVDMPLSTVAFSGRRKADQEISKAFGGKGCSTHSPNAQRPGPLGVRLMDDLHNAGYPLATINSDSFGSFDVKRTIEVYPHPALLSLLRCDYRVPYKVAKAARYWSGESLDVRKRKLLGEFNSIKDALERELGVFSLPLPTAQATERLSRLKRYEDGLDALLCAWVATKFIDGEARAYGDGTAAIWVPT